MVVQVINDFVSSKQNQCKKNEDRLMLYKVFNADTADSIYHITLSLLYREEDAWKFKYMSL